ncbi:MAG TPA: hypothetical protein VF516_08805, partial [Kofleriaceae bacterium]
SACPGEIRDELIDLESVASMLVVTLRRDRPARRRPELDHKVAAERERSGRLSGSPPTRFRQMASAADDYLNASVTHTRSCDSTPASRCW